MSSCVIRIKQVCKRLCKGFLIKDTRVFGITLCLVFSLYLDFTHTYTFVYYKHKYRIKHLLQWSLYLTTKQWFNGLRMKLQHCYKIPFEVHTFPCDFCGYCTFLQLIRSSMLSVCLFSFIAGMKQVANVLIS